MGVSEAGGEGGTIEFTTYGIRGYTQFGPWKGFGVDAVQDKVENWSLHRHRVAALHHLLEVSGIMVLRCGLTLTTTFCLRGIALF